MTELQIDRPFLKTLTETPSIGTACGPVVGLLTAFFGDGFSRTLVPDGFCLFQKAGARPQDLRGVFIAHMDEIGGCAYGIRTEGGFKARFWGTNDPALFADADLQGFDYLAGDASDTFDIRGEVIEVDGEERLAIHGEGVRPYRTGFTFRRETTFDDEFIYAKAVDPRVTLYTVCEAVRRLNDPSIGALLVMAEECAMDVARKAVTFLSRNAPNLELVVNADVPGLANLGDAKLNLPAIRIFEGHNFIDPSFGIRVASRLIDDGVALHLSAARSGSQTLLFTPLAPTLSIALPGENIHAPVGKMSLLGTSRCIDLLTAIGRRQLAGDL